MASGRFLGLMALSGGLSLFVILLAEHTQVSASLWLTNGALLGWLVSRPLARAWPWLLAGFLGYLAARLVTGAPLGQSVQLGLCNAAETTLVVMAVRYRLPDLTVRTPFIDFVRAALSGTVVACSLSSVVLALVQHIWATPNLWADINSLFRAHLLGMVVAGATSRVLLTTPWRDTVARHRPWPLAGHLSLLAGVTGLVFWQSSYPLLCLTFPPLLLLVFRHRFVGMVCGIVVVSMITIVATSWHHGPFNLVVGASSDLRTLLAQIYIGTVCLVALPVSLALGEQDRLQRNLRDSEARYRLLADNSGDVVMRIRANGEQPYVSPSVTDLLGWAVEDLRHERPDLVHPDDVAYVASVRNEVLHTGEPETTTYRVRHRDGHYLWVEAFWRRVPCPDDHGSMELLHAGRDVTKRVQAEQALVEHQARLRTIVDNVPAVIACIDLEERYTFINRFVEQVAGVSAVSIIGKTVREIRGAVLYERFQHYLERAFTGESVWFEYEATYLGVRLNFQTHYVPFRDAAGEVCGLYALTTEITHNKNVERELFRLAHQDSLTGLSNRRYFTGQLSKALEDARRHDTAVLLMLLDVDHFKAVNDSHGHAAGDAVLAAVGHCLQGCTDDGAWAARLGGDEFVVFCNHLDSEAEATQFMHAWWEKLHMAVLAGTQMVDVNMSVGGVFCKGSVSDAVLMKLADEALYSAKEAGRNTYRLVTCGLGEKA